MRESLSMIEVWLADLSCPDRDDAELGSLLSPDEVARADRFHFEIDRIRFIRRRALRRRWISKLLGLPPESLRFEVGRRGKPMLVNGPDGFRFNGSASGERALLAFAKGVEVGVDLERHRPFEPDLQGIVERFAPPERHVLANLEPLLRAQMFFECWARKEAVVKAIGDGLYLPLDRFSVPLAASVSAGPVSWSPGPIPGGPWWVTSLDSGPDSSAAIAADQAAAVSLHSWSWSS